MTRYKESFKGLIWSLPEDFIVEEIWNNRIYNIKHSRLTYLKEKIIRFQKKREYLHFTLVKYNWETIRALNYIGKKLGVSLKRFGIAGMKDKKALTAQRISLWKGSMKKLVRLKLSDMLLKDFEYADKRINLGDAIGNRFTLTVHITPNIKNKILEKVKCLMKIATTRGIPNYFGPQRFGRKNIEVGTAIKTGDLKSAVDLILKKIQPWRMGDLEAIPRVFWYEKRILSHLQKHPNDYAGALRRIPKRIRKIYIHALQSRLFNQKLRQAILKKNVPPTITVKGFSIQKMPELNTKSIERRTFLMLTNLKILKLKTNMIKLRFSLGKGEYATTLLSYLEKQEGLTF